MRVMGVKGLTLYHLKSHLQVWTQQLTLISSSYTLIHIYTTFCFLCVVGFFFIYNQFSFFLFLFFNLVFMSLLIFKYWLLFLHSFLCVLVRNLGLESSPTRISMIIRLRMVWEVTLLSRNPYFNFLFLNAFFLWAFSSLHFMRSLFFIYIHMFTVLINIYIFLRTMAASALELQRNSASSSAMIGRNMNEYASSINILIS